MDNEKYITIKELAELKGVSTRAIRLSKEKYITREITVKGKPIELKIRVGRIFVELTSESAIKEVEKICDDVLPFGYDINTSRTEYIRKHKTVSDAIKYGVGEDNLPDELIGMTDQTRQLAENLDYIDYDEVE